MRRVALINGGGGDIALALAKELKQREWDVMHPSRDVLDVMDEASVKLYFKEIKQVDLFIHNAGGDTRSCVFKSEFGRLGCGDGCAFKRWLFVFARGLKNNGATGKWWACFIDGLE
jgi:NAD(P)-dependent dehydrogenase (short-subunit alcohol dehydrogenase family)